jgi:hypothetical protein
MERWLSSRAATASHGQLLFVLPQRAPVSSALTLTNQKSQKQLDWSRKRGETLAVGVDLMDEVATALLQEGRIKRLEIKEAQLHSPIPVNRYLSTIAAQSPTKSSPKAKRE